VGVFNAVMVPSNDILINAFGLYINNMKTQTFVHRSRLNGEEMGLNYYTVLKGTPEIGKLSIIFHFQHFFCPKLLSCGHIALQKKYVKDRQLVS
jgi:hypothetical protein